VNGFTIFLYKLNFQIAKLREFGRLFYRRRLYQNVYEYDLPLVVADTEPKSYRFVKPDESQSTNCWKESFKLLVCLRASLK